MNNLAISVANFFVELSIAEEVDINAMKLFKLVYLAQEKALKSLGKPLFVDEIVVGEYGPLVNMISESYRDHCNDVITKPIVPSWMLFVPSLDQRSKRIVKEVWNGNKDSSALVLSTQTHKAGSAWDLAVKSYGSLSNAMGKRIDLDFLK